MPNNDQIIIELLKAIIKRLTQPENKEILFLIIGSILGFLSSFIIYSISEYKRKKELFSKYLVDLFILGEEIKHNAYAIQFEAYPLEYYIKESDFKMSLGTYKKENNGIIQNTENKLNNRIRDRELLLARLTGKITEHNIYFGISEKVNELKKKFDQFKTMPKRFDDCKDLQSLKAKYKIDFVDYIKKELDETFLVLLFNLLKEINKSVNEGKMKKKLKKFINLKS